LLLLSLETFNFTCKNHVIKLYSYKWDFFGRNDAKAETPVLWPPHVKSWLIGKDSDAGRDWGQEEKGTTEDEMAGWHHCLDGRESEWTPGVGDGQRGLACCDSWGHKESDTTEWLNWTELKENVENREQKYWFSTGHRGPLFLGLWVRFELFYNEGEFKISNKKSAIFKSALWKYYPTQNKEWNRAMAFTRIWFLWYTNVISWIWSVRLSVQFSRSVVSNSATPWIAACQASLSITSSWSLIKLMSI